VNETEEDSRSVDTSAVAEYLKYRQFLAGRELPPAMACSPKFYSTLITVFRQVAPLARFLNEPLTDRSA